MFKDSLFELIRREEVIIWAGAGLSLYAGYPSGKRLGEILVENLSPSEKELINISLPLPDLAEEIFRLKGGSRNYMIRLLRQTFSNVKPVHTNVHKDIASTPHFKTIITTNYDTLLEDEYEGKAEVILSSDHIPYLEKGKKHIFKVHGDLKVPNSIIITKTDYNNFFKSSEENIYWTVIKERLSTNTVLFVGYNLEDPNVSVIFEKITEALGTNRKESFLIAPSLPPHKVNDLVRKQIHYIDSTAEEFFAALIQNLKENVLDDLERGITSADTVREFLLNNKMFPKLSADEKNFKVHSVQSLDGEIEGKINFSVKNDPELIEELNNFVTGKTLGSLEINEDKLVNADLWYGGIKLPNSDGVSKLVFKSNPSKKAVVDIRFDDGLEIAEVPINVYSSPSVIEVHVLIKSANLVFSFPPKISNGTECKFSYKHKETSSNIDDELELYSLLDNLGRGRRFTIFLKDGKKYSGVLPAFSPLLEESEYFISLFNDLKDIEKHYDIRFSNFSVFGITKTVINKISQLMSSVRGESIEKEWSEELTTELVNYSNQSIEVIKQANEANFTLIDRNNVEETIELFGQSIDRGYRSVEVVEPYVTNLDEVIEK